MKTYTVIFMRTGRIIKHGYKYVKAKSVNEAYEKVADENNGVWVAYIIAGRQKLL